MTSRPQNYGIFSYPLPSSCPHLLLIYTKVHATSIATSSFWVPHSPSQINTNVILILPPRQRQFDRQRAEHQQRRRHLRRERRCLCEAAEPRRISLRELRRGSTVDLERRLGGTFRLQVGEGDHDRSGMNCTLFFLSIYLESLTVPISENMCMCARMLI